MLHLKYVELVAFVAKSATAIGRPEGAAKERAVAGMEPNVVGDLASSAQ